MKIPYPDCALGGDGKINSVLYWGGLGCVVETVSEFADLPIPVEVRNQARVHLWYERRFGSPAPAFTSSADAIDHFAAVVCCLGVRRSPTGELQVHAPHGYADLFAMRVRPNPRLAPRAVYEAKAQRWRSEWPDLVVEPWPSSGSTAG
jgi:hypothetical protein